MRVLAGQRQDPLVYSGFTLFSHLLEPLPRLLVVLRHALSFAVHESELVLRNHVSRRGGDEVRLKRKLEAV